MVTFITYLMWASVVLNIISIILNYIASKHSEKNVPFYAHLYFQELQKARRYRKSSERKGKIINQLIKQKIITVEQLKKVKGE